MWFLLLLLFTPVTPLNWGSINHSNGTVTNFSNTTQNIQIFFWQGESEGEVSAMYDPNLYYYTGIQTSQAGSNQLYLNGKINPGCKNATLIVNENESSWEVLISSNEWINVTKSYVSVSSKPIFTVWIDTPPNCRIEFNLLNFTLVSTDGKFI